MSNAIHVLLRETGNSIQIRTAYSQTKSDTIVMQLIAVYFYCVSQVRAAKCTKQQYKGVLCLNEDLKGRMGRDVNKCVFTVLM